MKQNENEKMQNKAMNDKDRHVTAKTRKNKFKKWVKRLGKITEPVKKNQENERNESDNQTILKQF